MVAGLTREWDMIEACAAAVRGRCTTAERLATALDARQRFPRRTWLRRVLADVAAGTASVLEHGYLRRVEQAHGLPPADRQQGDRVAGARIYRDAPYPAYDLDVELDGRLDHSALDRPRSRPGAGPRHRDQRSAQRPAGVGPGLRPALPHGGPGGSAARSRWLGRLAHAVLTDMPDRGGLTRSLLVDVTSRLRAALRPALSSPDSVGATISGMTYELGQGTGPLRGVKVVEIAGIGPGPHACMILADLGADVIRIDRPGGGMFGTGRRGPAQPRPAERRAGPQAARGGRDRPRAWSSGADVLVEGMRPGATRAARPRSRRVPRAQPARWSTAG